MEKIIIAGDAGGTKTRLALYRLTGPPDRHALECLVVNDFESNSAPSFEVKVREFLERHNSVGRINAACIGIPGPIVHGTVRATNLPWQIEEDTLADNLGIPRFRLVNIYTFLRDRSCCEEPDSLREEMAASRQPAAVISGYGMSGRFPICVRALDIFAGLLGSRAGNIVLTYVSTGGLYLGGGIPPKIISKLREGGTVGSYLRKGRLSSLVESTPMQVIMDEHAALLGAASIAAGLR